MADEAHDFINPITVGRHCALRKSAILAKSRATAIAAASRERARRSLETAARARALTKRTRERLAADSQIERDYA